MRLSDSSQIPPGKPALPRTVILGAGAIGLYAASLLARRGRQAIVIEAGDAQLGRFDAATYQSVGRNHVGIKLGRSRNLGGTTSLWGGQLVEFLPIDFAGRDWLPRSKWPVSYDEVAPYYEPTYLNLGVPPKMIRDEDVWREVSMKRPDLGPDFEVFLTRWMGVPNFAELFARQIQSDPNLMVLASHTAAGFRGTGGRIEAVRVVDSNGHSHWIEGDSFLLAAGTIENARLLLHAAHDPAWQAPWRNNDNVGRYFQDHIGGRLGAFMTSRASSPSRAKSGLSQAVPPRRSLQPQAHRHRQRLHPRLRNHPLPCPFDVEVRLGPPHLCSQRRANLSPPASRAGRAAGKPHHR